MLVWKTGRVGQGSMGTPLEGGLGASDADQMFCSGRDKGGCPVPQSPG